jgi:hypothetical protein
MVKVASNGNIFVVDRQPALDRILKSTNGGYTWTAALGLPAGAVVADIVLSPTYASDGYIYALVNTATCNVFQSSNGGVSFVQLGGNIGAATEVGTSIALPPTFSAGVGEIMVGTSDVGVATYGGMYIWGVLGTLNWANQAAPAGDYTSVTYSPAYPIDQTIIGVAAHAVTGMSVHSKVFTNAWDADFAAIVVSGALTDLGTLAVVASSMAFPSDFNASNPLARTFYLGTNSSAGVDDVFRVTLGGAAAALTSALVDVYSVAYSGTTASGTIYGGAIAGGYRSLSTALGSIWLPGGAVTGAGNAYVAVAAGIIYVGTGTGAANDESAFNVSDNGGLTFYQTGLIDTTLSAIVDFQPYSATEWYLVTQFVATNNSLWKTTDGGATYKRINVLVGVVAADAAAVRLSPAFATDKTMYFFEVGAHAGAVAPVLRMSQDAGVIWSGRFFPAALSVATHGVGDVIVIDQYTLYVGDIGGAAIYKSTNNCFFWTAQTIAVGGGTGVFQLTRDAASGALLAGTINGLVYRSTDGLAWASVGGPTAATGNTYVEFDANYSSNSIIYAADRGGAGAAGIWRFNCSTPLVPWAVINATPLATNARGIVVAPDGVLYAADAAAAGPLVGGILRILNPTAVAGWTAEQVASADGLTALDTLASLAYLPGSNVLYAIEIVGADKIVTYTDTLTAAVPAVASPADKAIAAAGGPVVVITPITGAPVTATYQVQWDNRVDWLTAALAAGVPFTTDSFVVPGVAGTTVYYRTRVATPVIGPWSQTYTAYIQLAPVAAVPGPVVAIGAAGTTGPGGFDVPLMPVFSWGNVPGATGFEFQLGKSVDMTGLSLDLTGANALGAVQTFKSTKSLSYSTTYYWRVRAINATSNSAWTNVMSFTTMSAPVTTTPSTVTAAAPTITVSIPTAAAPTVTVVVPTQPTPTTVVEKVSPTYIWAIIIIGAILVIAVIVLIVRTRRAV